MEILKIWYSIIYIVIFIDKTFSLRESNQNVLEQIVLMLVILVVAKPSNFITGNNKQI